MTPPKKKTTKTKSQVKPSSSESKLHPLTSRIKDETRETDLGLRVFESLQKLTLSQISQSMGGLLSEFGLNPAEDFFRYHFKSTENFCFLVRARVFNYDTGETQPHIYQIVKSVIQNVQFSDPRIIALIVYRLEASTLLRESFSHPHEPAKDKPVERMVTRPRLTPIVSFERSPEPVEQKGLTHTAVRQALPVEDDTDLSAYGVGD